MQTGKPVIISRRARTAIVSSRIRDWGPLMNRIRPACLGAIGATERVESLVRGAFVLYPFTKSRGFLPLCRPVARVDRRSPENESSDRSQGLDKRSPADHAEPLRVRREFGLGIRRTDTTPCFNRPRPASRRTHHPSDRDRNRDPGCPSLIRGVGPNSPHHQHKH